MARGPTYRVPFRRRREGKTDYRKRLELLLSRKPRVVVRRSNKLIRIQLIKEDSKGDRTILSSNSSELRNYGYDGGLSNIPAAYLTGLLFGKKATEDDFGEAIFDSGLQAPVHGSALFAALKGAIISGMEIPHDPSVFPPDERLRGEHIAAYYQNKTIVDNIEAVRANIVTVEEHEETS